MSLSKQHDPSLVEYCKYICIAIAVCFGWNAFFMCLGSLLVPMETLPVSGPPPQDVELEYILAFLSFELIVNLPGLALLEELFFRLFLLFPVVIVFRKHWPVVGIWIVVVALIFGLAHYPTRPSLLFVLVHQAFSGLIFNILFVKAGGLAGRPFKALFATWIVHLSFNLILSLPLFLLLVLDLWLRAMI